MPHVTASYFEKETHGVRCRFSRESGMCIISGQPVDRQEWPQIKLDEEGMSVIRAKDYSYLSASIGSIFIALRAGIQHAAIATIISTTAAAANEAKSVADTP